jgi:hypothetical protein
MSPDIDESAFVLVEPTVTDQPAGQTGPASPIARRAERVDPGEHVADFNRGDLQVAAGLGFAGNSPGPQTLVTAFTNWNLVEATADLGVFEREYLTLGVGADVWLGRPLLPEATYDLRADSDRSLDWRATSRGLALRGTAHYTWVSAFDPYLVVTFGGAWDTVYGRLADRDADGRFQTLGLRIGGGAGLQFVTAGWWVVGGELRYQAAPRLGTGLDIPLRTEAGSEVDDFDVERPQRAPRGFAWSFRIGRRF